MKKISLPFLNKKSPIPFVCIPLTNGQNIYALIDTGSEMTVYDKEAKENHPDIISSSKLVGKRIINGMHETIELDCYLAKIQLNVIGDKDESMVFFYTATEHDLGLALRPFTEEENLDIRIPLLIGSDFLIKYRAKIDMRKQCVTLYA